LEPVLRANDVPEIVLYLSPDTPAEPDDPALPVVPADPALPADPPPAAPDKFIDQVEYGPPPPPAILATSTTNAPVPAL